MPKEREQGIERGLVRFTLLTKEWEVYKRGAFSLSDRQRLQIGNELLNLDFTTIAGLAKKHHRQVKYMELDVLNGRGDRAFMLHLRRSGGLHEYWANIQIADPVYPDGSRYVRTPDRVLD